VIEYIKEQFDRCKGVDIYSSKTIAWIHKKSKWGRSATMTIERSDRKTSETVYPNGCLYIMGYSWGYQHVLAVDIEGETWRKIPCPRVSTFSIHQAQDHLCVCTVRGCDYPKLNIWIIEDYGTTCKWTLKHTFSILDVLLETSIDFGYLDVDQYYTTVHPE